MTLTSTPPEKNDRVIHSLTNYFYRNSPIHVFVMTSVHIYDQDSSYAFFMVKKRVKCYGSFSFYFMNVHIQVHGFNKFSIFFSSWIHNDLQVAVVGSKVDLTYDYEVRKVFFSKTEPNLV